MRIVLSEVLGRCDLQPVGEHAESVGRRNVTLSPKAGTPVVVRSKERRPERAVVAA